MGGVRPPSRSSRKTAGAFCVFSGYDYCSIFVMRRRIHTSPRKKMRNARNSLTNKVFHVVRGGDLKDPSRLFLLLAEGAEKELIATPKKMIMQRLWVVQWGTHIRDILRGCGGGLATFIIAFFLWRDTKNAFC
eukprot:GEMP01102320.1.p1 GENE.GEMP01102320.1~~GEMP01102320.1.p1  ORF type:complete len:133 (-),score=0.80 GEMP01102320.1:271-669(-)